jgi:transposase InsO family protein
MKQDYSILSLCENLDVSPSGYYDWRERRAAPGRRALENMTLAQDIQAIHEASRRTYGSPRIVMELRKRGKRHGRNRVARLMNEEGLLRTPEGPLSRPNHR